jgi:hypothetical protein
MVHNALETKASSLRTALTQAEKGNIAANAANKELAREVLQLAKTVKPPTTEDIKDPRYLSQMQVIDKEVETARRKWRIMKSSLSALIVGSGVDWAKDDVLTELVLDDEDELE